VEDKYVCSPSGGANVVDFPALQWLAKQSKPRFWVSDGQVTGIGDRSSGINRLQCEILERQKSIQRVENVDAAVKALNKLIKE
jgi:hypothetical protein